KFSIGLVALLLINIISESKLRGSSKNIKGGYNCVCFSESPISELAALFALVEIANNKNEKLVMNHMV
ncbi:hypothetical protein IIB49_03165, partial [Patescibacteria group bacterium]|nr:hypothetical protein [Patescibacteria group bacterium]